MKIIFDENLLELEVAETASAQIVLDRTLTNEEIKKPRARNNLSEKLPVQSEKRTPATFKMGRMRTLLISHGLPPRQRRNLPPEKARLRIERTGKPTAPRIARKGRGWCRTDHCCSAIGQCRYSVALKWVGLAPD